MGENKVMIKMAHKYFTYDREQNEFETHESKEEARLYIRERLQKLIDDEVWQFIDKKWGAIGKEWDGSVYIYSEPYEFDSSGRFYKHISGDCLLFTAHEYIKNIKLNDVPWEESLTVRPEKYR